MRFTFRYKLEQTSEGENDTWIIIDAERAGHYPPENDPIAICNSETDAEFVTAALNDAR